MEYTKDPRKIQYVRPFLYPKQEALLFHTARYVYVEASTKSGKTHGCIVWLVEQAILHGAPGRRFWWVAPTDDQAMIAFHRIKHALPKGMFKANESDGYIELPNGARIEFKSAKTPDNLYGEDVYAAVLDEASRCRRDSFLALRSTLTATRGPIRLIANVKGKANWFYQECRKVEREMGTKGRIYGRITAQDAVDAGVLDQDEIDDARNVLTEKDFLELYMAVAQDDADAFMQSEYVEKAMKRDDVRPYGQLIIGADPSQGQGDSACFAFRRGPVIEGIEEHPEMDEFGFKAHAIRLIEVMKPAKFFMDGTGFGATIGKELQEKFPDIVVFKHMQERSLFPDEYTNTRAQCWGELRKLLQDTADPFKLPDHEGLAIELTCIKKKDDTKGRIGLESKEDLAARGYDSPNIADACAYTCMEPVSFYTTNKINYPEQRRRRSLT
jgi:hypothetical protein